MKLEWDEEKARQNLRKHGVSFALAQEISTIRWPAYVRIQITPEVRSERSSLVVPEREEFCWYPSQAGTKSFESSVPETSRNASDVRMKKKQSPEPNDDLRSEYAADFFHGMKPNRFATEEKIYKQTLVTLDADVSEVFQSSEEVNTVLRTAIRAMREALPGTTPPSKRRAS